LELMSAKKRAAAAAIERYVADLVDDEQQEPAEALELLVGAGPPAWPPPAG